MTCTYWTEQRHYVGQGCVMIFYLLDEEHEKGVPMEKKGRNKTG